MDEILAHFSDNNLFPGELTLDGKIQRFKVDEGDSKKSGWYLGYQNHTRKSGELFFVVVYGNYRTGDLFKFISDDIKMSAEDKKAMKDQIEKAKKANEADRAILHEQTSKEVQAKWDTLSDTGVSDYLNRKQLADAKNLGIKFATKEGFYVPLTDVDGKLWSVQKIQNDGGKFFHPCGRVEECFHVIGTLDSSDTIRIAEGFATAASIALATKEACVVAFNSANLVRVAQALKRKYSSKVFVICGDDDRWTTRPRDGIDEPYNPGREAAEEAAKICLGKAVFPIFKNLVEKKTTDYNDLHLAEGLDAVRDQIIPIVVDRLFVLPLGFKEKEYFYTSSANRQIVSVSKFSEVDFLNIMPLAYWESVFPGAGAQRVDWVTARSAMMAQARARGIFQARHVRGAGVWNDEGRVIVNMGDHLIVDGNRIDLSDVESRYFYTLGSALSSLHSSPLSSDDCNLLIDACSSFKWLKSDFGFLMAGALVTSRICGALPVRPHTWITGGASTGKTTLLERLITPIVGSSVLYVQGATTEAGIRQSLRADAIPVIFDEFETTGQKSAENVSSVIELMRAAWSESSAMIVKGGTMGNASAYQVRFSAIVSSIRTKLTNDADKSRFAIIELAPHGSDADHWTKLAKLLSQIDTEYGERLFARTIKLVPVLIANFKTLKKVLASRSSQRFGDQYGMLLAGYSILLQDTPLTIQEAEGLADHVQLGEEKSEAKTADHDDCLTAFKTCRVSLQDNIGRRDYSVSDAMGNSKSDKYLENSLLAIGIRVEWDKVIIAGHSHAELEKMIFKSTQWSKTWINSLARIEGAVKKHNRVGGYIGVSVEIPIKHFKY